jgi:uncharacterized membrane protein YphA (DoxX/SURF4 family)
MLFFHSSKYEMKIKPAIDTFIRLSTGVLFIFSGLIKLNDPIGTEIKLEEYFEVFSTDFAGFFKYFIPASLEIGLILVILEVVLGFALLINYRMEITTRVLIALILFFTFLTFYSAYFEKVTDCGCFGDAIPLKPWQSFYKDLILLAFSLHLVWYRKKFGPLVNNKIADISMASITVICLIVGIYSIEHLPYIDFRPYKVGDNIKENMQPEEQPIFEYTFEKDGEQVKSQKYLLESNGYKLVEYRIINEDKTTPKITDFNVWNPDVGDFTEQVFEGIKLVVIIVDADKANRKHMNSISELVEQVGSRIESIVLTSSDPTIFEPFRHEYQLAIPYFFADATVLKAMIRSNPGTMLLNNGIVMGKWHYNDTPGPNELLDALE